MQSSSGTSFSRRPRSAQSAATASRRGPLAATPPPSATASHSPRFSARFSFEVSCPTAAAWKLAARSARRAAALLGAEVAAEVDERRLQTAEAEVEAGVARHRQRQLEPLRVPLFGELLQRRPAGEAEPEQAGDLVEGLAGGVVERLAEHLVAAVVADAGEQRVAAAGEEAEEGRLERLRGEEVGGDVPLQVVDRDQRQPARRGDRLRRASPTNSAPIRPGPAVTATASISIQQTHLPPQRRLDHRHRQVEVVARGDLGNDPAEFRMRLVLRRDDVGEDSAAVDDGRAGVVAGSLNSEITGWPRSVQAT